VGGVEVPFSQRLAAGEFIDRLGTVGLHRVASSAFGSRAAMTGAAATKRGQDLPLRQRHLIRLPPIHVQIAHLLVLGSTENPANMIDRADLKEALN